MEVVWKIPLTNLQLLKGEIHFWRTNLDLPIMGFQELFQRLSIDERMRAERFHFEKDGKQYVVGVGILREILGSYVGIEPSELRFCHGKYGKPRLSDVFGNETVYFNMSYSEGLALYGFSRDCEIGVDIEFVRDFPEMDKIAERFFSRKENEVFLSLPESKKKEAFFNCWTRKEAFVKAIGDGLYQPLDNFDVALIPGVPARLLRTEGDSKTASRWFIQDLKPAPGFIAAFAVEEYGCQPHFWQWPDHSTRALA